MNSDPGHENRGWTSGDRFCLEDIKNQDFDFSLSFFFVLFFHFFFFFALPFGVAFGGAQRLVFLALHSRITPGSAWDHVGPQRLNPDQPYARQWSSPLYSDLKNHHFEDRKITILSLSGMKLRLLKKKHPN